jgi:hypothetical protein
MSTGGITRDLTEQQPLYAFIDLEIDGQHLSYFGNKDYNESVISLSVERKGVSNLSLAGSKFTIELYDDTAMRLEELLANSIPAGSRWKTTKVLRDKGELVTEDTINEAEKAKNEEEKSSDKGAVFTEEEAKEYNSHINNSDNWVKAGDKKKERANNKSSNVKVAYGWVNRRGQVIESINIKGKALKYSLNLEGPTSTLSLECVVEADSFGSDVIKSKSYPANEWGGVPSKIVADLCNTVGLKVGDIHDSKPLLKEDGTPMDFSVQNQSVRQFIATNFLEKTCPVESDQPGYSFYSAGDPELVYFVPVNMPDSVVVQSTKVTEQMTQSQAQIENNQKKLSVGRIRSSNTEPYQLVMGVSANNTSEDVEHTTATGSVYFVGDFRVSGLKKYVPDNKDINYFFNEKADYAWLSTKGKEFIKNKVDKYSKIYLMVGYNDLDNIIQYAKEINSLAKEVDKEGSQLYFVTVLPVDTYKDHKLKLSIIQAFNNSIRQNKVRELEVVDIFDGVLSSLSNKNITKSDGVEYTKRLYQDVYSRIIYYKGVDNREIEVHKKKLSISYKNLLKPVSYTEDKIENTEHSKLLERDVVNSVAVLLSAAEDKKVANAIQELDYLREDINKGKIPYKLGSTTYNKQAFLKLREKMRMSDYNRVTESVMEMLLPDTIHNDETKKVTGTSTGISESIVGKDANKFNKTIESINEIAGLLGTDSKVSDMVVNTIQKINDNRNIFVSDKSSIADQKKAAYDLATEMINTLIPGGGHKVSNIINKVSNILTLDKDAIKAGDYTEIGNLLQDGLGIENTKVKKYVDSVSSIMNYCKQGKHTAEDTQEFAKGVLENVLGDKAKKVEHLVDTANTIYKSVTGIKDVTDINNAIDSLGDILNKNKKVSKYVNTAKRVLDVINGGGDKIKGLGDIGKSTFPSIPIVAKGGTIGGVVASQLPIKLPNPTPIVDKGSILTGDKPVTIASGVGAGELDNADRTELGKKEEELPLTKEQFAKGMRSVTFGGKKQIMEICGEFEIYTGRRDGRVISFTPEFESDKICSNKLPSSALTIDSVRNEMLECTVEGVDSSLPHEAYNSNGTGIDSTVVLGMSSSSFKNLELSATSMWSRYYGNVYAASMEIIGDTRIRMQGYIKVAVFTKYGFLHHTSGVYMITGITDNISDGQFTSSLELQKNSNEMKKKEKGKKLDENKKGKDQDGGKYWVKQTDGVSVEGCIEGVTDALDALGKWFFDKTGYKLVLTAGTNGNHASGPHSHANGWKMDVNDYGGPENCPQGFLFNSDNSLGPLARGFTDYGRSLGLAMNLEATGTDNVHFDICMDGEEWNVDNFGGVHNNGGWHG